MTFVRTMPFRRVAVCTLAVACSAGVLVTARGLHPQPTAGQKRWLIAHRGASAYAPENTVPAFQLAADQGATFVEFDLRLTRDGQIVCLHDETLERTTDDELKAKGLDQPGADPRTPVLLQSFTASSLGPRRGLASEWGCSGPPRRQEARPPSSSLGDARRLVEGLGQQAASGSDATPAAGGFNYME